MLYQYWSESVKKYPNEVALRHPELPDGMTFSELDRRARSLSAHPIPDSGFLTAFGDDLDFFTTILAAWKNHLPVLILESRNTLPMPLRVPIPAGTALIKQTCGASGLERSLFFGETQVLAEGLRNIQSLRLTPGHRGIAAISLAHSYGFGCLALPLLLGGIPIDILTSPLPVFVQQALAQDGEFFLPGVPALWKTWWLTRVLDSRSIRLALSAGAPLSLELESALHGDNGIKLHNFYGTTETGAVAFNTSDEPRTDASLIGGILPGVDVTISPAGHILVQTDAAATTADVLLSDDEFSKPHYHTMDTGEVKNRRLFWHSHTGNAINVAGRKVSPARIKRACESTPGTSNVRVTSTRSRDFERFEEVSVSLKLHPSTDLKSVKDAVYKKLESWEVPRHWDIQP